MEEKQKSSGEFNVINPQTDDDFFAIGRILLTRSTCLKTQTSALIVANVKIVSWGVNMCCPQGQIYGLPVSECPRTNKETGTYYELCMPIHAEIVAAINAFGISHVEQKSLWHFPGFTLKLKHYEGFFKNRNAKLYLLGHYWACQECVDFLKLIGIVEIKFDDLSGGATLKKYKTTDLTGKPNALDVSGCLLEGFVTVRIEPPAVKDFCARHGVKEEEISYLPDGDLSDRDASRRLLYLVKVPRGAEDEKVKTFKKDPAVTAANTLLIKREAAQ